jgi:hypothetical protein
MAQAAEGNVSGQAGLLLAAYLFYTHSFERALSILEHCLQPGQRNDSSTSARLQTLLGFVLLEQHAREVAELQDARDLQMALQLFDGVLQQDHGDLEVRRRTAAHHQTTARQQQTTAVLAAACAGKGTAQHNAIFCLQKCTGTSFHCPYRLHFVDVLLQAVLGKARALEATNEARAAWELLSEASLQLPWAVPLLVELARLTLAQQDWEGLADVVGRLQQADGGNILGLAYTGECSSRKSSC